MNPTALTAVPTGSKTTAARFNSVMPDRLQVGAAPPSAGPLDQLSRGRLRRLLVGWFGEFPTLDAHLELLDTRGCWYAEKALGEWDREHPDSFFGLVRHVVRTQLGGPVPAPDIEGWLAGGQPDDPALADVWQQMLVFRYLPWLPPAAAPRQETNAGLEMVDAIVAGWPEDQLDGFLRGYGALENNLERRLIVLPPVDA